MVQQKNSTGLDPCLWNSDQLSIDGFSNNVERHAVPQLRPSCDWTPRLSSAAPIEEGFESLLHGANLAKWITPDGDNGHRIIIDYDARSEAEGE